MQKVRLKSSNVSRNNKSSELNSTNINHNEHFKLNRCALQSGKILWLCDEHSQNENIQVLTETETVSTVAYQSDEFNMILMEELKKTNKN